MIGFGPWLYRPLQMPRQKDSVSVLATGRSNKLEVAAVFFALGLSVGRQSGGRCCLGWLDNSLRLLSRLARPVAPTDPF
jgi:hypothetical protein